MQQRLSNFPRSTRRPLAMLGAFVMGLACADANAAPPLPKGGQFVAGSGTIATGAQSVTIGQTSTRGVIDWNSFDIGAGKVVTINNGTGATLNRVTGGTASSILGTLNATGSVYLINPQGVVIGSSGVVAAGGRFLASALDVSNAAFMGAGALTFANGGNGAIVNLGRIGSSGGDVILIARSMVSNQGSISAAKGTAELATGSQILLRDSTSGQQVFVNAGSGGTVSNAGSLSAAQVNLQAADGNVYALAGNTSAIRATGTAKRDGHVWLVADKGHVQIHDSITATNADGSGGTVDSSGTTLNIGGSTVRAGQWNLTVPVSYSIDQTTASALSASLNQGTSIDMEAKGNASSLSLSGGIDWKSGATLTLGAGRNVGVTKSGSISNTGSGDLVLRADAGGVDNGASVVNAGKIDWSNSTGLVSVLYDMNGAFTPGTLLSNMRWVPTAFSGDATQITAYKLVNNVADLRNMSKDLSDNYALGKDFSVGAIDPIAPIYSNPFNGQFDGFGHTLSNLHATIANNAYFGGLFGVIGATGVVRNLHIVDANVTGRAAASYGILAGRNEGVVAYVTTSGKVGGIAGGAGQGGVVGYNDGLIERSSSSASILSGGSANNIGDSGGLAAANFGTIAQSFATGDVSDKYARDGGLVGINGGVISQSYATGAVTSAVSAGGLVQANSGVIDESFATGKVGAAAGGAPEQYGGIAYLNNGVLNPNVYWNRDTTQRSNAVGDPDSLSLPDTNGLSAAQMRKASSFVGWDFSAGGVWAMPTGATHPVLQWQQAKK